MGDMKTTTNTGAATKTYTLRGSDDVPAVVWSADVCMIAGRWYIDLRRNGHEVAERIDPDDLVTTIRTVCARSWKAAPRIAARLTA